MLYFKDESVDTSLTLQTVHSGCLLVAFLCDHSLKADQGFQYNAVNIFRVVRPWSEAALMTYKLLICYLYKSGTHERVNR